MNKPYVLTYTEARGVGKRYCARHNLQKTQKMERIQIPLEAGASVFLELEPFTIAAGGNIRIKMALRILANKLYVFCS